jgi:hypothetical protein
MNTDTVLGQGGPAGQHVREAFSGWPMIFGWAAMLLFAFYACTHMVAAGDTWVAMACGRHFVHHGVDTVEPFSANSHKPGPTPEEVQTWPKWAQWITNTVGLKTVRYWHPTGWVNQNWLTHVIFYKLTTTLGSETQPYYDALVLWKFAIYILAAVALYFTARVYGVNRALAAVFVCFALLIGRSFFDVRPAGFSNLLVAVLLLILALASYRRSLYIWLLVPLVVFWSNVHGGYIYAFVMLVPFVVWHLLMNLPRRWTIAGYHIVLWLVLYGLSNRLYHHEYLTPTAMWKDGLFYLLLLAAAASVALSYSKRIREGAIISYHLGASCILFLILLSRFFPVMPLGLNSVARDSLDTFVAGARLAYLGIFSFAMILSVVVILLKDKVVQVMDMNGVLHTMAAGAVAFVAMVIFNPFHLTNLTHTFVISVSEHAARWRDVQEWNRAFDWHNQVGTAVPFLVMYILGWLALLLWGVVCARMLRRLTPPPARKRVKTPPVDYAWPKVDLALVVIAAMTVYMAIRSRRFIPIAGFVACPLLALLIDQVVRTIAVLIRSPRTGKLQAPAPPQASGMKAPVSGADKTGREVLGQPSEVSGRREPLFSLQRWGSLRPTTHPVRPLSESILTLAGAVAVTLLAVWWGWWFKYVYLEPWPADTKLTSVFMRMTASDAKPFNACEFIRRNKLSGNMFNYWTEGGFIAWGEDPDPQTGQIPLRLFMDGRAQAAYDVAAFDRWTSIMGGEPIVRRAMMTRGRLVAQDYIDVGAWVEEQLRKYDVWTVLMPNGQFDKPFTLGLEYSRDWRLVFLSDKEKLFVDVMSPKGAQLYHAMMTGKAIYPDEYSADLTLGSNLLRSTDIDQKKKGLELTIRAFNSNPTPAPALEMYSAAQFPELRPRIDQVCEQYVQVFEKSKKKYAAQDGYNLRLEAARLALARLEQAAKASGDALLAETYRSQKDRYGAERDGLALLKRW